MPNLNTAILESVPIQLPPLPIQQRIASILGALDDKIEVNRRINRTLEAMAQTLFKHWFVDFGPFQDGAFVESELGPIPEGWRVGVVENLMELAYGKGLPATKRVSGPYPVFGSSGKVGIHTEFLVKAPGIIVGRKGTIGHLSWAKEDFWPIDTTYYVLPKATSYSFEYLYYVLRSLKLETRNNDSAVPGLNRNNTNRLPIVIPSNEALDQFNKVVKLWFRMIEHCDRETLGLNSTRDYLLPKLLSGEVSVEAAEDVVEAGVSI
jgi:type I restriction enzyme S subunit